MHFKEFKEIARFPGVIETTDATYAKICPPSNQHIAYLDCAMKHSVILLAVCDASRKFTYITKRYAGSIQDQRYSLLSALEQDITSAPNECLLRKDLHIIGYSGFTLQMELMVPFKNSGIQVAATT